MSEDSNTPSTSNDEMPVADALELMRAMNRARRAARAKNPTGPKFRQGPLPDVVIPSEDPIEDIRRSIAKLVAWTSAVVTPKVNPTASEPPPHTTPAPRADGPEPGRWVWWNDQRYQVPRGTVYALIAYMWDRETASYDSLDGPVFDTPSDGTVRSYVNKVNNVLTGIGIPWKLCSDSRGRIVTKETRHNPQPGAQA